MFSPMWKDPRRDWEARKVVEDITMNKYIRDELRCLKKNMVNYTKVGFRATMSRSG